MKVHLVLNHIVCLINGCVTLQFEKWHKVEETSHKKSASDKNAKNEQ